MIRKLAPVAGLDEASASAAPREQEQKILFGGMSHLAGPWSFL
jgi:hypothetical protein